MRPPDLLNGRLKLRHLVLATAIAEHGSVLRAAERLHLAQPAATRALRELEDILGVTLFTRGPRGMTPTPLGAAFVMHARSALAELRRAGDRITEMSNGELGTVTVGTLLAGANVLLPHAIASLKRGRPGVTIVIHEGTFDTLVPQVIDGEMDLIVGRLNPIANLPGLRQVTLYSEPVRLFVRSGHPAAELRRPGLRELRGYPWVIPLESTALRHELELAFRREGLDLPEDRVECSAAQTIRTLLHETDTIAALPSLVAGTDDGLIKLAVDLESVRRAVGVTLPANRPLSPSGALLLDHLRHAAQTIARHPAP